MQISSAARLNNFEIVAWKTKKCRKKTSDLDLVLVHTRENSPFAKWMSGSFSNDDDDDGNENVKKAIGLLSKTTSLRFFVHFLSLLHDYDVKMPSFTFYGGRKQATTNFSFSF